MIKVNLFGAYSTFNNGYFEIFLKGSFFCKNQQIKSAADLANLLLDNGMAEVNHKLYDYANNELLKYTNGEFSFVITGANNAILAVDIVRTDPLFVVENDGTRVITDSLSKIDDELVVNVKRIEEYIACNMIVGNKTIYKNVISVQAGEALFMEGNNINSERYFEFLPKKETKKYQRVQSFSRDYENVMLSVFSRMIDNNPTVNNWLVPLSGGRDSRLAVNLLYRLGVRNVICYSYGNLNNEQSTISKQVAEALGYKWFFVEYTEKKWYDLQRNGIFDAYIRYSFNGVSTPHLQDFLAVYELTKKNIICTDDVVVKSHGDFIAGNHLLDTDINIRTLDEAIDRVVRQHTKIEDKKSISYSKIRSLYEKSNTESINIPEHFDWQERQAKLMINSIRVYDFFGIKSHLPYWDRESVDFWLGICAEQRVKRNMFLKVVQSLFVNQLANVPYSDMVKSSSRTSLQRRIVRLFPRAIINWVLKVTGRKVYLNEGLNLIFSLKSKSVKELLSPMDDFPEQSLLYFKDILMRPAYQVNDNFITALYTVRKVVLDKRKL